MGNVHDSVWVKRATLRRDQGRKRFLFCGQVFLAVEGACSPATESWQVKGHDLTPNQ